MPTFGFLRKNTYNGILCRSNTKVRVKENKHCKQGQESSHYFVSKPRKYPIGYVNYLTCVLVCMSKGVTDQPALAAFQIFYEKNCHITARDIARLNT